MFKITELLHNHEIGSYAVIKMDKLELFLTTLINITGIILSD